MIGMVRSILRASSRAGLRARVGVGPALVATALELLLRLGEPGVRLGQHPHPEEHDHQRRHQRAEREARDRDVVGARDVQRRHAPAARAASCPPREMATSRAPAPSAPRAISTVSSVSPEYDTANASVRGPTNAGVR